MKKDRSVMGQKKEVIASFLIPFSILLVIFIFADVYPFGNKTLLITDLNNQYISFLAAFKTLFSGDATVFYDFSKGMGGEMTGLFAYYLASPFNLLLLFFSAKTMPLAIHLLIILKLSCSSLSMYCYLNKIHGQDSASLIFSVAYALMGFNMSYFYNLMWQDVIILLPLVLLGLHRLIEDKKSGLYIFTLSLAIFSNYYIAFMLCIFLVFYFLYQCLLRDMYRDKAVLRSTVWRFIRSSVLAAVLISFMLVPLVFSLLGGKAQADIGQNLSSLNVRMLIKELIPFRALATGLMPSLSKFYPLTTTWQEVQTGRANIYIGLLPLIFVVLYFFNRSIKRKDKILSLVFIFIFYWSFSSEVLDTVWHGLNSPYWFPYRYSFLLSFFILQLAYQSFLQFKEGLTKRSVLAVSILLLLFCIVLASNRVDLLNQKSLILTFIIITCAVVVLYLSLKKGLKKQYFSVLLILLAILNVFDLGLNAWHSITTLQVASSAKMDEYNVFVQDIQPIIEDIKLSDEGFYRVEKTFHRSLNDPMLLDYNGVSHYSSSEKDHVKAYLGHLGLRTQGTWAYYNRGSTMGADALLGIRYLLTKEALNTKDYDLEARYEMDGDIYTLYKNDLALPLVMKLHGEANEISQMDLDEEETNPFTKMNTIWKHLGDDKAKAIYEAVPFEMQFENLFVETTGTYTRYKKIDPAHDAYLHLEWTMKEDNAVYTYMTAPRFQDVELILNDEVIGNYFAVHAWEAQALAYFNQGDAIRLSIKANADFLDIEDIFIATEDQVEIRKIAKDLINDAPDLQEESEASFKMEIKVDEEDRSLLLFNIPFDLGWQVLVNGEALETKMVFDALMAVSLDGMEAGVHEIQLRFVPRGLKLGIILTLTAVLCLILILLTERIRST